MSNYHVEPADKPQALTTEAIKSLRHEQVQGLSRRQLMRGALGAGIGLWLLEVTAGHDRLPLAEPRRAASGASSQIGTLDDVKTAERQPADRRGLPGLLRRGARVRDPHRPVAAAVHRRARTRPATAPRSTSGRCTSAARTSAASRTRASRTSGSSAPATARATTGSGIKADGPQYGPAPREHGPLLDHRRRRRRADHRHRQDHARARCPSRSASPASSRRARPTGCI